MNTKRHFVNRINNICIRTVHKLNFLNASYYLRNPHNNQTVFLIIGMKLDRRIEEAVPAGQQLQELGMRLRCDDTSSEQVIKYPVLQ